MCTNAHFCFRLFIVHKGKLHYSPPFDSLPIFSWCFVMNYDSYQIDNRLTVADFYYKFHNLSHYNLPDWFAIYSPWTLNMVKCATSFLFLLDLAHRFYCMLHFNSWLDPWLLTIIPLVQYEHMPAICNMPGIQEMPDARSSNNKRCPRKPYNRPSCGSL